MPGTRGEATEPETETAMPPTDDDELLPGEDHDDEPDFRPTDAERAFTAHFDQETSADHPGPACTWLRENAVQPGLMVAFQWAVQPRESLDIRPNDERPLAQFSAPWPSAELFGARVREIVAAYPWLEPYVTPDPWPPTAADPAEGTAGQIPMHRLVRGRWYVGRGRNGNVGRWSGQHFLVAAEKFDRFVVKHEGYYAERDGCFQPFRMIDEGRMVEPFGRSGWDAHYGRRMEFGPERHGGEGRDR